MKKFVLISFALLATNSFADELHNFDQVKSAIVAGKPVHIVVEFAKCTPVSATRMNVEPSTIGVFTPDAIILNSDSTSNYIATSLTHFTLNNPLSVNKPVYEFVRYTITPDNNVNIKANVLDAPTYSQIGGTFSVNCALDSAVKINA